MLNRKLELFKSRFCVAEGKIIDRPVFRGVANVVPANAGTYNSGRQLMAKMSAAVLERRAAAYAFAGTTQADSKSQTTADTTSRSRGPIRPRFAIKFPYPPIRGRRECRAPDAPAAARAMIVAERTRVSQVTPESPGIPRAMVLRFPSCSPAIGLFCHRHLRNCFHRLDTSVGVSGPHDFAVR